MATNPHVGAGPAVPSTGGGDAMSLITVDHAGVVSRQPQSSSDRYAPAPIPPRGWHRLYRVPSVARFLAPLPPDLLLRDVRDDLEYVVARHPGPEVPTRPLDLPGDRHRAPPEPDCRDGNLQGGIRAVLRAGLRAAGRREGDHGRPCACNRARARTHHRREGIVGRARVDRPRRCRDGRQRSRSCRAGLASFTRPRIDRVEAVRGFSSPSEAI